MKSRDGKGRFTKNREENYLFLAIPSLNTVISFIVICFFFIPWLVIISRFHPLERLEFLLTKAMGINAGNEESDPPKKNGLFY